MAARSLRSQPSFWLVLLFIVLVWYQFSKQKTPDETLDIALPDNGKPGSMKTEKSKAPSIAIVTFVTEQRSYLHLSLKNKDHYARRHGYDFIVDYESHTRRGTTYWKFDMVEKLIKRNPDKWDWIWWMDFDTLITNTDTPLTTIIDDELANVTDPSSIDWLTTHDCNGLNTGSFIVRGHQRSLQFLSDVWKLADRKKDDGHDPSEQDAMKWLIEEDKTQGARTKQVPQWKLNAFPQEIACFDESRQVWEKGMFFLHFAGAWAHVKGDDPTGQMMRKYEPDIIWGDWKDFY